MKKLLVLLSLIFSLVAGSQTIVKNVDADTFKAYIVKNKYLLIDLRTDAEIAKKGKIKGATQIDYFNKNAESEIEKLDKHNTVLIYCAGGGRSSECAELMQKKGFREVVNLEKGFDEWKRKGFDIETK